MQSKSAPGLRPSARAGFSEASRSFLNEDGFQFGPVIAENLKGALTAVTSGAPQKLDAAQSEFKMSRMEKRAPQITLSDAP